LKSRRISPFDVVVNIAFLLFGSAIPFDGRAMTVSLRMPMKIQDRSPVRRSFAMR
jgi:hypothetical protein